MLQQFFSTNVFRLLIFQNVSSLKKISTASLCNQVHVFCSIGYGKKLNNKQMVNISSKKMSNAINIADIC